jgi:hypothetical protein
MSQNRSLLWCLCNLATCRKELQKMVIDMSHVHAMAIVTRSARPHEKHRPWDFCSLDPSLKVRRCLLFCCACNPVSENNCYIPLIFSMSQKIKTCRTMSHSFATCRNKSQ